MYVIAYNDINEIIDYIKVDAQAWAINEIFKIEESVDIVGVTSIKFAYIYKRN